MNIQKLLSLVEGHVTDLLTKSLPEKLYFHNLHHTLGVVKAAKEIGLHCNLTEHELVIVQIAAWFHDTGYTKTYRGHEDGSITLCFDFLVKQGLDDSSIVKIIALIASTKYPQKPQDKLERVICDADMYHLGGEDYEHFSHCLRREWEEQIELHYDDEEWNEKNVAFFSEHKYFTEYAKAFFEQGKQVNLQTIDHLVTSSYQTK